MYNKIQSTCSLKIQNVKLIDKLPYERYNFNIMATTILNSSNTKK